MFREIIAALVLTLIVSPSSALIIDERNGEFATGVYMRVSDIKKKTANSLNRVRMINRMVLSTDKFAETCRFHDYLIPCTSTSRSTGPYYYHFKDRIPYIPDLKADVQNYLDSEYFRRIEVPFSSPFVSRSPRNEVIKRYEMTSDFKFDDMLVRNNALSKLDSQLTNPYSYDNVDILSAQNPNDPPVRAAIKTWEKLAELYASEHCESECPAVIKVRHRDGQESIQYCETSSRMSVTRRETSFEKVSMQLLESDIQPKQCFVMIYKENGVIFYPSIRTIYICPECAYFVPDYNHSDFSNTTNKNIVRSQYACRAPDMTSAQTLVSRFEKAFEAKPFTLAKTSVEQPQSASDAATYRFDARLQPSALFDGWRETSTYVWTIRFDAAENRLKLDVVASVFVSKHNPESESRYTGLEQDQRVRLLSAIDKAFTAEAACSKLP